MSKKDWNKIDEEIMYFFRNNLTDPNSRGTDTTETFNGTGSKTDFELTDSGVKNVSGVSVGGTEKEYGADYTVSIDTSTGVGTVKFVTAPGSGTNNVSITYHYGKTWVYPDQPRVDLSINSYPRVAILNVSGVMTQIGLGTGTTQTSMLKDIKVYGANEYEVRDIINEAKNAIVNKKDGLYNVSFMKPTGISPLIKEGQRNERIVSMNLTAELPYIFED